jgi:hypothetical protein
VALRGSPRTPSLPTALSQALIAFTIEFDNEFEHRVEHHTGNRKGGGVWLTSMVMWSNFMRLDDATVLTHRIGGPDDRGPLFTRKRRLS